MSKKQPFTAETEAAHKLRDETRAAANEARAMARKAPDGPEKDALILAAKLAEIPARQAQSEFTAERQELRRRKG